VKGLDVLPKDMKDIALVFDYTMMELQMQVASRYVFCQNYFSTRGAKPTETC
jgi:hypothetical protein